MQRLVWSGLILCATAIPACAQWEMQDAHVTADLRGIDYVGGGVAWASGSHGTVLRTEDMGFVWQLCATPPDAKDLDFRGVQAFDNNTAIVMSSGTGDKSRLYKTTDGCQTWKLVFTNPDKDGFFDALYYEPDFDTVFVLGDPVNGQFRLFSSTYNEDKMTLGKFSADWNGHPLTSAPGQAAFAASNSLIVENVGDGMFSFITGGSRSEIIHEEHGLDSKKGLFSEWSRSSLPFQPCDSCGAFSLASSPYDEKRKLKAVVVVGGDYKQPNSYSKTAAFSMDWGNTFQLSATTPHGYRSSVAFDKRAKAWISVGPNGTDISTDDGRNWRALKPGPGDAPDADRSWNALSLPFVVGPKGRIGILRDSAFAGMAKSPDTRDGKGAK